MDYKEKDQLIRRISNGKVYISVEYQYEFVPIIINDPSVALLQECDFHYNILYEDLSDGILPTLDESYDILKKQKIWTNKMSDDLDQLPQAIKQFNKELSVSQFKKNQQRAIIKSLKKAKERLEELNRIKNQLYHCTVEYVCQQDKFRRILLKNVEFINKQDGDRKLLNSITFLNHLSVLYYRESNIEESKIREISRSDPFRIAWVLSKEGGNSLFPICTTQMTDLQKLLVSWAKIYDFCYESQNRPADDVICDDQAFNSWYESEISRIKKENQSGRADNINKNAGEEIFIFADEEGSKEVFELNTPIVRQTIKQREKYIREHGEVLEQQLPDVQQRLKMETNRLLSSTMTGR